MSGSGPWVRGGLGGVLLLGRGLEELPGAGCVADGGAGVDAEGGGEVQRVGVPSPARLSPITAFSRSWALAEWAWSGKPAIRAWTGS